MMLLLLHIVLALTSVAYTTYIVFRPRYANMYIQYGFIAATLVSGTLLVVMSHASILASCTTGLIYSLLVILGTVFSRVRNASAV